MQHDSGNPLRRSRRITTTMPHSHIGKIRPSTAPIMTEGTTLLGKNRVIACCGRNSSRMPATIAPSTINGIASQRTLLKLMMKSWSCSFTATPPGYRRDNLVTNAKGRQFARDYSPEQGDSEQERGSHATVSTMARAEMGGGVGEPSSFIVAGAGSG